MALSVLWCSVGAAQCAQYSPYYRRIPTAADCPARSKPVSHCGLDQSEETGCCTMYVTLRTNGSHFQYIFTVYSILSTGLRLLLVMISRDRPESREHGGCSQQ